MIVKAIAAFGRLVLLIASIALVIGAALFMLGAYCASWPIMRASGMTRKRAATVQTVASLITLAQAFGADEP